MRIYENIVDSVMIQPKKYMDILGILRFNGDTMGMYWNCTGEIMGKNVQKNTILNIFEPYMCHGQNMALSIFHGL
jgi:hypothetical protein